MSGGYQYNLKEESALPGENGQLLHGMEKLFPRSQSLGTTKKNKQYFLSKITAQ